PGNRVPQNFSSFRHVGDPPLCPRSSGWFKLLSLRNAQSGKENRHGMEKEFAAGCKTARRIKRQKRTQSQARLRNLNEDVDQCPICEVVVPLFGTSVPMAHRPVFEAYVISFWVEPLTTRPTTSALPDPASVPLG